MAESIQGYNHSSNF